MLIVIEATKLEQYSMIRKYLPQILNWDQFHLPNGWNDVILTFHLFRVQELQAVVIPDCMFSPVPHDFSLDDVIILWK